jgi:hypothetical protein
MALKISGHQRNGSEVVVTVEGESVDEVNSSAARALAYDHRHEMGMGNAGVEAIGGSYPINADKPDEEIDHEAVKVGGIRLKYRHDFRLTPTI